VRAQGGEHPQRGGEDHGAVEGAVERIERRGQPAPAITVSTAGKGLPVGRELRQCEAEMKIASTDAVHVRMLDPVERP
jgi:hypothetical protein